VVAIVLGVVFRDEVVAAISLAGTALVLAGAFLTSRREERAGPPAPDVEARIDASGQRHEP
jgi:drug/metabolite transporter (DMT)-like permease